MLRERFGAVRSADTHLEGEILKLLSSGIGAKGSRNQHLCDGPAQSWISSKASARPVRLHRSSRWIGVVLAFWLHFAAFCAALYPASRALADQDDRPNVLLIIVDDMNDYGFYRTMPGVKMPYLSEFKQSAVLFTRAYCSAPSCVPSRASLLSGQQPFRTGSYLNGSDPWTKPAMRDVESLPELFKRGGYTTWGAGKLFHAKIDGARRQRAFDNRPHGGGFGPFVYEDDQLLGEWWGASAWKGPDADFPDVRNADAAIEFINQHRDRPFFLALGLWRPHTPFTAPSRFFNMYNVAEVPMPPAGYQSTDLDDVPPMGRELSEVWGDRWLATGADSPDQWRKIVWGYLACTSFADWSAGRVIEALDASPHADNTLVVFAGDNGYHCGEKQHFEKSTLWEAAARVPLAIRPPGRRREGAACGRTVSLLDLFPTLMDYCRLPSPPQRIDGESLRPLLENPDAPWDLPAVTIYEEQYFSARDQRWRYIRYPDGSEELYDHDADPWELENAAARAELQRVKQRLNSHAPKNWAKSLGGRKG